MSRSRKKHPCAVVPAVPSERHERVERVERVDKRLVHQAERHAVKIALQTGREVLPHIREVSEMWSKDGRQWVDPRRDPWVLRK